MTSVHTHVGLLWALLGCVCCAMLAAADPAPEVPDPLGLGPRLALLDYLRSEWKLKTPDQASYQDLCRIYWSEHCKRYPAEELPDPAKEKSRERIRELASKLVRRGMTVPENADEATLEAMVRQQEINMATPIERTPVPESAPEPAAAVVKAKPAESAKGRPVEAAKAPAATEAEEWKRQLAALWKAREEQVPADAPLGWTAAMPEMANEANEFRYRRAGGAYEFDEPIPPPAPGLEVWVHVTRLEPSGFGEVVPRFQADRWLPGWWDAGARRWTSIPPAKAGWIRDSQACQIILSRILIGRQGKLVREATWRRLHSEADVKMVLETGVLDPALVQLFAEVATEYGVVLPLDGIEVETHRIERRYRTVALYEETLTAAQNAAQGDPENELVKRSLNQLLTLGQSINAAAATRRQHFITMLGRLGALP